jgi:nickel-dependent lactate racemase
MKITLPYGKEQISFSVDSSVFAGMYDPQPASGAEDPLAEIEYAMDHPIGTKPLEEMVSPGKKVCIIVDDISRPTPVSTILPCVVARLNACGVMDQDIRVVVALGSHRYMTQSELKERVGEDIFKRCQVMNSEFRKPEGLVNVGRTPEGVEIPVTKSVVESDIRIGIGNLAPHPVMGWGGGGKILYPGVTGERIVAYFHLKGGLVEENLFGQETTPVREMMETWVESIGLDFIINTVLNDKFEICKVVAGHYIKAHREGVRLAQQLLGYQVTEKVDVVVASSHPADQDFWQSPKAMYAAEPALKGESGGTIILLSPNYEGVGPHPEYINAMGRDDGDDLVRACIQGEHGLGDPLAIAVGNSMSKMRRRRKLVVVSDGVTYEEMALCGCTHYPKDQLQQAIDDALAEYPGGRLAAIQNGADTFLYE